LVDAGNRRIQVLSASGAAVGVVGAPNDTSAPLHRPVGVAVAPDGRCYVGDVARSAVVPFAADGTPGEPIGAHGSDHSFVGISALQVAAGELVVVESFQPRIQVRDLDGTWIRSLDLPEHFTAADLAVDGDRVYVVSMDGQLVRTTLSGSGSGAVERLGHIGTHARGLHLGADGVIVAAHPVPIDVVR
ncbi:MAG: NHL repeat-containing protein, partial [Microthrixaceae bacterium]